MMVRQVCRERVRLLAGGALLCSACSTSVDTSYRTDLITVDQLDMERVVATEPSLFFVDAILRNDTTDTVNNFHHAGFSAGSTTAEFELSYNRGTNTLVGCVDPDPWDIPPGVTRAVRMRVDFRADPAVLDVACKFDPQTPGFAYQDSRTYTAPRAGSAFSSDFVGPVTMELQATMNASCTPDDCPMHALVRASGNIGIPP